MSKEKPGILDVREALLAKAEQHADPAVQGLILECRSLAAKDLEGKPLAFDRRRREYDKLEAVLVSIIHDGVPVAGAMVAAGLPAPEPFVPDEHGLIRSDRPCDRAGNK